MNNDMLNQHRKTERIKASECANWLLSHGISAVTTVELAALLGIPKTHVPQRMASLKRKNEIISPVEGLWIPVPPEYLTWGAPPAIEIIDAIMQHLGISYYVGWLSAAELHGASHHAPQVFQVATSRALRARTSGRSRFQFYHRARIKQVLLTQIDTRSGKVPVSSKETTMLDVANDIRLVGGIDNAANLIIELCENIKPDIDALVTLSKLYPITAVRRLGFLMDSYADVSGLGKLKDMCFKRAKVLSLLDPQSGNSGTANTEWSIRVNREVSPDI
jgi:predicted transcriptional regulator of viral defense system